jgi:hypothetical protein
MTIVIRMTSVLIFALGVASCFEGDDSKLRKCLQKWKSVDAIRGPIPEVKKVVRRETIVRDLGNGKGAFRYVYLNAAGHEDTMICEH